jgi:hypothetical protein
MVRIQILHRNKQYFAITDIDIPRVRDTTVYPDYRSGPNLSKFVMSRHINMTNFITIESHTKRSLFSSASDNADNEDIYIILRV